MQLTRRAATVAGTVVILTGTVAGAAAGLAYAAIPNADGTIHACYATSNGALRVVSGGRCATTEKRLSWTSEGATTLVTGAPILLQPGQTGSGSVSCPAGTYVVGTGVRNVGDGGSSDPELSIGDIDISDDRTTVTVEGYNPRPVGSTSLASVLRPQATCA